MFVLAVWSPAIAAFLLVRRHYGAAGVRGFLRRLTLWRMPAAWWTFLVLGVPAIVYAGAAIKATIGDAVPFSPSPWHDVLPLLGFALIIGPVEEFGWRGVALPLLQRRFPPLWAGLILGLGVGAVHAPAFLVSGTPQSAWSFGPYVRGVLAVSVIWTRPRAVMVVAGWCSGWRSRGRAAAVDGRDADGRVSLVAFSASLPDVAQTAAAVSRDLALGDRVLPCRSCTAPMSPCGVCGGAVDVDRACPSWVVAVSDATMARRWRAW